MEIQLISYGLMVIGTLTVLGWLLDDFLDKVKALLIPVAKFIRWWRTEFKSLL
jgi:hypothetical protein